MAIGARGLVRGADPSAPPRAPTVIPGGGLVLAIPEIARAMTFIAHRPASRARRRPA